MERYQLKFSDAASCKLCTAFLFDGLRHEDQVKGFEQFARAISTAVDVFIKEGQMVSFMHRRSGRVAAVPVSISQTEPNTRIIGLPIEIGRLSANRKQINRVIKITEWAWSRASKDSGRSNPKSYKAARFFSPVLSMYINMLMICEADDRTFRSIINYVLRQVRRFLSGHVASAFDTLRGIARLRKAGGVFSPTLQFAA